MFDSAVAAGMPSITFELYGVQFNGELTLDFQTSNPWSHGRYATIVIEDGVVNNSESTGHVITLKGSLYYGSTILINRGYYEFGSVSSSVLLQLSGELVISSMSSLVIQNTQIMRTGGSSLQLFTYVAVAASSVSIASGGDLLILNNQLIMKDFGTTSAVNVVVFGLSNKFTLNITNQQSRLLIVGNEVIFSNVGSDTTVDYIRVFFLFTDVLHVVDVGLLNVTSNSLTVANETHTSGSQVCVVRVSSLVVIRDQGAYCPIRG